jgi:kynureninase
MKLWRSCCVSTWWLTELGWMEMSAERGSRRSGRLAGADPEVTTTTLGSSAAHLRAQQQPRRQQQRRRLLSEGRRRHQRACRSAIAGGGIRLGLPPAL